jgi:uncharacterized membrane protein
MSQGATAEGTNALAMTKNSPARPAILRDTLDAHLRLFIAIAIGIVVGLVLPRRWGLLVDLLTAVDTGAFLHIVLAWIMMLRANEQAMRRRARQQDDARWIILLLCAAAAAASLCVLPGLLAGLDKAPPTEKTLHLVLSIFTILCAWFFLQTIFTLHYAHEFYDAPAQDVKAVDRGGLNFAGGAKTVGYTDFAYFAFTIGMTFQTSDTGVTSVRMRRLTLTHAIFAFFFNTGILALAINVVAGMI